RVLFRSAVSIPTGSAGTGSLTAFLLPPFSLFLARCVATGVGLKTTMLLHRHPTPDFLKPRRLQVGHHHSGTGVMLGQNQPPGINNQGMAIGLAALRVPAALPRSNHKTLVLNGPSP